MTHAAKQECPGELHNETKREKKLIASIHNDSAIRTIRGERIILAADLARIYGVETRTLNQAVKRNKEKFPTDFMFQLTR